VKRTNPVVRAILVLLALSGAPTFLACSAQAATVFSNYNGIDCACGALGGFDASGFTPAGNYDFSGAAAFVKNRSPGGGPQPFSMALYSSSTSTGAPSASLWTSGTLTAPGPDLTATLVSASYDGPPILLRGGRSYFLVLDLLGEDSPAWLASGSSFTPFYSSTDGTSWMNLDENNLQFKVFGAPAAVVPEPASWTMLLLGFGGLGFAASRGAKGKGGVREAH
jgi:hypothetical protein